MFVSAGNNWPILTDPLPMREGRERYQETGGAGQKLSLGTELHQQEGWKQNLGGYRLGRRAGLLRRGF